MSTNPTAEEERQDAAADALFLAGVDYDARLARLRAIVAALSAAAAATLGAAIALRALGMTPVPERVLAMVARYGALPAAIGYGLLAFTSWPGVGAAIDSGPAAERRFLAFLRYQTASGRACTLLVVGSMTESAIYWYMGGVLPLALAVVLLAGLLWKFPRRDRMETAIENATA